MQDHRAVRAAFTDPAEFWSSPLYRELSAAVAADPYLIELASFAQAGQVPTFLFFGAVHWLLLGDGNSDTDGDTDGDTDTELANYYPSLRGDQARAPAGAGPALAAFARTHSEEIRALVSTRLVQTNHVQRTLGLRIGLALIAAQVGDAPVHLLEVGTSAGLILRQAAYGYRLGNRQLGNWQFGDAAAPVQLHAQWRASVAPTDLDAIPSLASVTGIDLHPLDPSIEADRRWLRALVWPENRRQAQVLTTALDLAAAAPVTIWAGDAVELCPRWGADIASGATRVVFHCATRMHVAADRLAAFDAAIDALGAAGPLYRIAIESPPDPDPRRAPRSVGAGLAITRPDGRTVTTMAVDGHLDWVEPLTDLDQRRPAGR